MTKKKVMRKSSYLFLRIDSADRQEIKDFARENGYYNISEFIRVSMLSICRNKKAIKELKENNNA